MSVLRCISLLRAFKVTRSAGRHLLAECPSFAASASSGHSRSAGQQVSRSPLTSRMSVLRCISLLRAFKVTRSAGHQQNVRPSLHPPPQGIQGHRVSRSPAECPSFAASVSSGHLRSPGQQVTSQNVSSSLHPPPRAIQDHQVSRSPARMSLLRCIRLLRAFKVTRKVSRSPAEHQYLTVSISSGHSRSPGHQVTSRKSVPHCIHLRRAFKVKRSAGQQQNVFHSQHPPPQAI